MPICQLCGCNEKLINAHIIPKQLYEPIRLASSDGSPSDQVPRIYSIGTQKPQQTQNGIYDSSILCCKCDNKIGSWDQYGQEILLKSPSKEQYLCDEKGKPSFYKIDQDKFDYKQLKLFIMSILWRAEITDHYFFAQIKLGPFKKTLKDMIISGDPGRKNDFSVILFKYEGNFSEIMPQPTKKRKDGLNFYHFRFPKGGFLIKVDRRPFPSKLERVILTPNQDLLIKVGEYQDSEEYKCLLNNRNKICL